MSRKKRQRSRRLMVLDTNVLMHDPSCLFRFHEHDVFIPMIVLEELDNNKRGHSEVARNARQASRTMEELVQGASRQEIEKGLHLPKLQDSNPSGGRLFFQTRTLNYDLPRDLPSNLPDNTILATVLALQMTNPDRSVVLVSKDINLRIKASALGITAEDYRDDQVLDDLSLLAPASSPCPSVSGNATAKISARGRRTARPITRSPAPTSRSGIPINSSTTARTRDSRPSCASSTNARRRSRSASIIAAAITTSGASTHATANRTSRSICSWIPRSISSRYSAMPAPARLCSLSPQGLRKC